MALGFLWCNIGFADEKTDKVLENCADRAFYSITDIKNFLPSLYSSSLEYKKINSRNEEIKIKIKKASNKNLSKLKKWRSENPSPNMLDYKQKRTSIGTLTRPGFNEDIEKKNKAERQFIIEISGKQNLLIEEQKNLEERIETLIRVSASIYIKHSDLTLKTKAKFVKGYMKYYKNCETEYQSRPSSFILQWGD